MTYTSISEAQSDAEIVITKIAVRSADDAREGGPAYRLLQKQISAIGGDPDMMIVSIHPHFKAVDLISPPYSKAIAIATSPRIAQASSFLPPAQSVFLSETTPA